MSRHTVTELLKSYLHGNFKVLALKDNVEVFLILNGDVCNISYVLEIPYFSINVIRNMSFDNNKIILDFIARNSILINYV